MQQMMADADNRRLLLSAAAVAGTGIAAVWLLRRWQQERQLPPGPRGLPLVGVLPWVRPNQLHRSVMDMCQKYGNVVSFRLGPQLFVAVNTYDLVKELLEDSRFTGKPQTWLTEKVAQGCGIIFSEGPSWQHHRRTTLRILRDFGFARLRSAEMVEDQIDGVLELLDDLCQKREPFRLLNTFTEVTNGIIASLTIARRFERTDPEFEFINDFTKSLFSTPAVANVAVSFPEPIARLVPSARRLIQRLLSVNDFIRQQLRVREAAMVDEDTEPECLCDAYIQERRRAERNGDFETYKEMQIVRVVAEFFLAGTDTTARTMEWLCLYMAYHPSVLRRVQQELDSVVGRSRRPAIGDRGSLHYLSAVVEETYRIVSLAAVGFIHRAMQDTTFRGFRIPSDAIILPFIYGSSHDPDVWESPDDYRPERFLDNDGKFAGSGKNIPFLLGRRSCAGESLARMEVFLVFSALAQRYDIRVDDEFADKKEEILRGSIGILRMPGEHRLVFSRR